MRADVVWPAVWAVCFVVGVIYGTMMESPGLLPLRTNLRGGAAAGSSGGGSVSTCSVVHVPILLYRIQISSSNPNVLLYYTLLLSVESHPTT